jgi:enoyl-CoA hydratase/carnithine racemase
MKLPDGLDLRVADDVAFLTLDRPAQRNAITMDMWRALPGVMAGMSADPQAKIVILAGAGGHFAAGADIGEFEAAFSTAERAADYGALLRGAMQAVADCPKPVIAQIEGACIGGGCGLALACDLRIAADTARLGITPAKLGLAYSLEDTKRLTDAVGLSKARMMLFTGQLLNGAQALAFGLVDQLAASADLAGIVHALARDIADASQVSVRMTKRIVALIAQGAAHDTEETRRLFADAATGADVAEGRRAFLEKRKPRFPTR